MEGDRPPRHARAQAGGPNKLPRVLKIIHWKSTRTSISIESLKRSGVRSLAEVFRDLKRVYEAQEIYCSRLPRTRRAATKKRNPPPFPKK